MTKRIIKIILILLAIFFILLGGMWLLGRNQAKKNGTVVLSFKQFLGLSSKTVSTTGNQGTLSSVFTGGSSTGNGLGNTAGSGSGLNGNSTAVTGTGNAGTPDNSTQISQFTTDIFAPDTSTYNSNGSIGTGNLAGAGSGLGTGNLTGSDNGLGNSQTTTSGGTTTSGSGLSASAASACTTADTTITFTAAEIQQLNALQTQYNQISANLASTDDVAAELANYSTYKLEESKIAELQNFCQTNTPLLTDPAYQRHVPTPFWHDSAQDSETFTAGTVSTTSVAPNPQTAESFLERILRINLW